MELRLSELRRRRERYPRGWIHPDLPVSDASRASPSSLAFASPARATAAAMTVLGSEHRSCSSRALLLDPKWATSPNPAQLLPG